MAAQRARRRCTGVRAGCTTAERAVAFSVAGAPHGACKLCPCACNLCWGAQRRCCILPNHDVSLRLKAWTFTTPGLLWGVWLCGETRLHACTGMGLRRMLWLRCNAILLMYGA